MKLYDVPKDSRIKILDANEDEFYNVPPGTPQINEGEELNFHHIDGMYSYCTRDSGEVVHIAAWTEVELI